MTTRHTLTLPSPLSLAHASAGAAVPSLSECLALGIRTALLQAGLPVPPDPPPGRTTAANVARRQKKLSAPSI